MGFVKAMRIRNRICEASKKQGAPEYCFGCPLSASNNPTHTACVSFIQDTPELAEPILEQWDKEHPVQTRADKLRELFPNIKVFGDNIPVVCPLDLFEEYPCNEEEITNADDIDKCFKCRRDFWTAEYTEKNNE